MTIEAFERHAALTAALSKLFDTALAVEPGGSIDAAWRKQLEALGVPPRDDVRAIAQQELGMLRGALPIEVEACVLAIAALIDPTYVDGARATWRVFAPMYLERARHKPTSMFAHAIASAHAKTRAHWFRPPGGYVARCTTCGGPRLAIENALACQFCVTGRLSNS